jgi:hypothetical protein
MHQSSESFAALASALAKAQAELVNPEKSLTARHLARRDSARASDQQHGSAAGVAAHGGFRALGQGLRTPFLAGRHFRLYLRGQPKSGHREHHRS